jgi:hypothetical protein
MGIAAQVGGASNVQNALACDGRICHIQETKTPAPNERSGAVARSK